MLALLCLISLLTFNSRTASFAEEESGEAVLINVTGAIDPSIEHYIKRGIAKADAGKATALIVTIDTPGGMLESTKNIASAILTSETPVVVYVYPEGVTSTSAGFFILMASDVAAMAPSTSTGSAHPVVLKGKLDETMSKKITHYSAALMRSLAERQGRNVSFAEQAVRHSFSVTEKEALKKNVIEFVAKDPAELLNAIDGHEYNKKTEKRTLRTAGSAIVELPMSLMEKFLHLLANPNVFPTLMALGALGLAFEIRTPGIGFPGVAGAICLILGLVSASQLPVNIAGAALLILGFILLVAEMFVISHGLLTLGGVACVVMGGIFMFDSDEQFYRVSWWVLGSIVAFGLLMVAMIATAVSHLRSAKRHPFELSGLIGERAVVKAALSPEGMALVHGELWKAVSEDGSTIEAGEIARVEAVLGGMKLSVRRESSSPPGGRPNG